MSNAKKGIEAKARRERVRQQVFGSESANEVFSKNRNGYTSMPRCIPLVSRLINALGDKKIKAGDIYIALWFLNWGESLIERVNFRAVLYQAGHVARGKSVHRNWKDRTKLLERLGFIKIREHKLDPQGAILLIDPHLAVMRLRSIPEYGDLAAFKEWFKEFESFCEDWGVSLSSYADKPVETPDAQMHHQGVSETLGDVQ